MKRLLVRKRRQGKRWERLEIEADVVPNWVDEFTWVTFMDCEDG